jgi:hypothetical protein
MNVPDVVAGGVFQVDPPRYLDHVQQRFGRGGRIQLLSTICTLVLSKHPAQTRPGICAIKSSATRNQG